MNTVLLLVLMVLVVGSGGYRDRAHESIITAINANGCAKPTKIEIKPAVYNSWPNNNGVM
jgi:hypothetical protein